MKAPTWDAEIVPQVVDDVLDASNVRTGRRGQCQDPEMSMSKTHMLDDRTVGVLLERAMGLVHHNKTTRDASNTPFARSFATVCGVQ